jgi:hypothetical protein
MNTGEMVDYFRNCVNERPVAGDPDETALFWQKEDILQYLNNSQIRYNAFVHNLDESYNIREQEYLYTGTPIKEIVLPKDLQKIKFVEYYSSATQDIGVEVFPITIVEKFRLNMIYPNRYYFQDNKIRFKPEIAGIYKVVIIYLQRLPKLFDDQDVCALPEEIHENIVHYAVEKGLLRDKQGSLSNYWKEIRKQGDLDAANFIVPRQAQQPNSVMSRVDWETGIFGLNVGF